MMLPHKERLFEPGNKKLYEEDGLYVDFTFFEVFPLKIKNGNPTHALEGASSIVISTEMAQRFFGNENPISKQMMIHKNLFQVKAIVEMDLKFHLQFNYLATIATLLIPKERMQRWSWHQFYNYVKLNRCVNVSALQSKFQNDIEQKSESEYAEGLSGCLVFCDKWL